MVKIKRNGVFRIVPEHRVQKYLDKGYSVVVDEKENLPLDNFHGKMNLPQDIPEENSAVEAEPVEEEALPQEPGQQTKGSGRGRRSVSENKV